MAYFGSESLNSKAADWHTTMGVNVMGSAFMVQAALEVIPFFLLYTRISKRDTRQVVFVFFHFNGGGGLAYVDLSEPQRLKAIEY